MPAAHLQRQCRSSRCAIISLQHSSVLLAGFLVQVCWPGCGVCAAVFGLAAFAAPATVRAPAKLSVDAGWVAVVVQKWYLGHTLPLAVRAEESLMCSCLLASSGCQHTATQWFAWLASRTCCCL